MMGTIRQLPLWVRTGVMIFPPLILAGLVLQVVAPASNCLLFWMIIPSIVFEEALEQHFYAASNSQALNLLFIVAFWFAVGALAGLSAGKLHRK